MTNHSKVAIKRGPFWTLGTLLGDKFEWKIVESIRVCFWGGTNNY